MALLLPALEPRFLSASSPWSRVFSPLPRPLPNPELLVGVRASGQALRDAQTRDGTGVDDGWDDVNDEDAMEEDPAPAPVAKVGKAAKGTAGKAGAKDAGTRR